MILSPVRGGFRISQPFGGNPLAYKKFGLKGHNGQDIALPIGTPVYSPIDGVAEFRDSGKEGYGIHVRITEEKLGLCRQVVLAHFDSWDTKDLDIISTHKYRVMAGQLVGRSGNSGNSTGPHLHWGLRRIERGRVLSYNNGYFGYEDIYEKDWITKNEPSIY